MNLCNQFQEAPVKQLMKTIKGVYAMPYQPTDNYMMEAEAAVKIDQDSAEIHRQSLGSWEWQKPHEFEAGTLQTMHLLNTDL